MRTPAGIGRHARLTLAQLTCVYAAGKFAIPGLLDGMDCAASMVGPTSPGLKMQMTIERKRSLDHIVTLANESCDKLIASPRERLQELGRCEAEYGGLPGWYARVGF